MRSRAGLPIRAVGVFSYLVLAQLRVHLLVGFDLRSYGLAPLRTHLLVRHPTPKAALRLGAFVAQHDKKSGLLPIFCRGDPAFEKIGSLRAGGEGLFRELLDLRRSVWAWEHIC